MKPAKLTPEAIERAAQLRAAGESHNSIRDHLLEEFGINVVRSAIQSALERHEDKKRREAALKKAEIEEAKLSADAARTVAACEAAADLPARIHDVLVSGRVVRPPVSPTVSSSSA